MKNHPIFILDDHVDTTQMLEMVLSADGYPVKACNDGAHALVELHSCTQPCILFIDYTLPDFDPLDFLQKAKLVNNPVHIVLMTGVDAKSKAAEMGIPYYIQKPFDPFTVLEMVHKLYTVCASS